jgi:thiamine-phosphate pyrophosphorylase
MNDRADIAHLSNADGVHLGETDISVREARKILGADKIIGVTSHNIAEAIAAQRQGADYISVGPFYPTPTKPNLKPGGFDYLKDVVKHIRIPYFLIGGINQDNISQLRRYHRKLASQPLRVAISSGILLQQDIIKATKQIKKTL